MTVYFVDRPLPGLTQDMIEATQRRVGAIAARFTAEGRPVRYIRSIFVPGDSRCMCLFESDDPDLVRELNEVAGVPYSRIVEAMDLTP